MGIMDIDEEIRNAIELEIRRLEEEEEEVQNKKLMEKKEIRDMRLKLLINISPLEIIDNLVAENVNQIELVIDIIDHYFIYQYWSPRSATTSTNSSSSYSLSCQHHDFLHPRDDDDEEMILSSCQPFSDSPQRIKIIINEGVFAASDDHIMSTLLRDVDVLFEYSIVTTYEHLKDVKRRIARSMAEAKAHVLRAKPKRVRICVDVSEVVKKYYGSKETATFVAAMEAATDASSLAYDDDYDTHYHPTKANNIKRASRLSQEALQVKTFEKKDSLFIGNSNSNSNSNSRVVVDEQYSSSYSCPICLKELCTGVDNYYVYKMPCSHVFHCTCLNNWFQERNTCPLCRFELPAWNGLQS